MSKPCSHDVRSRPYESGPFALRYRRAASQPKGSRLIRFGLSPSTSLRTALSKPAAEARTAATLSSTPSRPSFALRYRRAAKVLPGRCARCRHTRNAEESRPRQGRAGAHAANPVQSRHSGTRRQPKDSTSRCPMARADRCTSSGTADAPRRIKPGQFACRPPCQAVEQSREPRSGRGRAEPHSFALHPRRRLFAKCSSRLPRRMDPQADPPSVGHNGCERAEPDGRHAARGARTHEAPVWRLAGSQSRFRCGIGRRTATHAA